MNKDIYELIKNICKYKDKYGECGALKRVGVDRPCKETSCPFIENFKQVIIKEVRKRRRK